MKTRQGGYQSAFDGVTYVIRPQTPKRPRKKSRSSAEISIDDLPDDLLIAIFARLSKSASSAVDLINVFMCCKRFCYLGTQAKALREVSPMALCVSVRHWSDGAYRFLLKCAHSGNIHAAYRLGMIKFYCLDDKYGAIQWLYMAANKGHAPAMYSLAIIHFNGSAGTRESRDLRTAIVYCVKAATRGHFEALRELGHCLQDGYGLPRNLVDGRGLLLEANAREGIDAYIMLVSQSPILAREAAGSFTPADSSVQQSVSGSHVPVLGTSPAAREAPEGSSEGVLEDVKEDSDDSSEVVEGQIVSETAGVSSASDTAAAASGDSSVSVAESARVVDADVAAASTGAASAASVVSITESEEPVAEAMEIDDPVEEASRTGAAEESPAAVEGVSPVGGPEEAENEVADAERDEPEEGAVESHVPPDVIARLVNNHRRAEILLAEVTKRLEREGLTHVAGMDIIRLIIWHAFGMPNEMGRSVLLSNVGHIGSMGVRGLLARCAWYGFGERCRCGVSDRYGGYEVTRYYRLCPFAVNHFLLEWYKRKPVVGEPGWKVCNNTHCGRRETRVQEFRCCSACSTARYCSRSCQAQDWKNGHRVLCTPPELQEEQ